MIKRGPGILQQSLRPTRQAADQGGDRTRDRIQEEQPGGGDGDRRQQHGVKDEGPRGEPEPAVSVDRDRGAEAEQHGERPDDQGVQGRVDQHLAEERVAPEIAVVLQADPPGGGSGLAEALEGAEDGDHEGPVGEDQQEHERRREQCRRQPDRRPADPPTRPDTGYRQCPHLRAECGHEHPPGLPRGLVGARGRRRPRSPLVVAAPETAGGDTSTRTPDPSIEAPHA